MAGIIRTVIREHCAHGGNKYEYNLETRWLGRTYLVGVLFGGLGGLYMAFWAYGGFPARLGFALLALVWLGSGTIAYQRIRTQQIESHRQWMMRNYALTFAAVTLRLWQVVFQITGVEFDVAYVIVAWLCWIPNLLVAEWMVGRKPGQYNSNGSASPADHH